MCGIGAIFHFGQSKNFPRSIAAANATSRRGRDNTSTKRLKLGGMTCDLCFHRLAINGLREEANQPMTKNDAVLICNGEI